MSDQPTLTPERPAAPPEPPAMPVDSKAAEVAQALRDSKASGEMRESLRRSLAQKKKEKDQAGGKKHAKFDISLDRYEAKFVIPRTLVPQIREYIRPYCEPDPNGRGEPPEYVITTLQLDSLDLALHHAKENEALYRFKLRVRTYGDPVGNAPVFMEVKRKLRTTIVKTRAAIPFDAWGEHLIRDIKLTLPFKNKKEELGFIEFVRLSREIDARPAILIRYIRESYFGTMDRYARITFDRRLQYQPTTSWTDWGRSGRWMSIDTPLIQNKGLTYSGVVLEVKTLSDAPQWIINLIMEFDLVRTGHCKYSNGVWAEALFRLNTDRPLSEMEYARYW